MKIEEAIKQQQFKSEEQKLVVNLIYTHNWLLDKMEPFFEKHEITVQQFNILRIMRGQHPRFTTIPQIRERMLDKQPDVSRLLDRLVKKQFAERQIDPEDRRKIRFSISSRGLKLLEKMEPDLEKMNQVSNNLTSQEKKTLNQLLDKLRD